MGRVWAIAVEIVLRWSSVSDFRQRVDAAMTWNWRARRGKRPKMVVFCTSSSCPAGTGSNRCNAVATHCYATGNEPFARAETLKRLTPCEYICKVWTKEPERARSRGASQTTGTRLAATAAGEMTSMSSGARHRAVYRTRGVALRLAPSRANPA